MWRRPDTGEESHKIRGEDLKTDFTSHNLTTGEFSSQLKFEKNTEHKKPSRIICFQCFQKIGHTFKTEKKKKLQILGLARIERFYVWGGWGETKEFALKMTLSIKYPNTELLAVKYLTWAQHSDWYSEKTKSNLSLKFWHLWWITGPQKSHANQVRDV